MEKKMQELIYVKLPKICKERKYPDTLLKFIQNTVKEADKLVLDGDLEGHRSHQQKIDDFVTEFEGEIPDCVKNHPNFKEATYKMVCSGCLRVFNGTSSLRRHIKTCEEVIQSEKLTLLNEIKSFIYKCPVEGCKGGTNMAQHLVIHRKLGIDQRNWIRNRLIASDPYFHFRGKSGQSLDLKNLYKGKNKEDIDFNIEYGDLPSDEEDDEQARKEDQTIEVNQSQPREEQAQKEDQTIEVNQSQPNSQNKQKRSKRQKKKNCKYV